MKLNNIIFDFGEYKAIFEPLPKGTRSADNSYPLSYEVTILRGKDALCAFNTSQYANKSNAKAMIEEEIKQS